MISLKNKWKEKIIEIVLLIRRKLKVELVYRVGLSITH